MVLPFALQKQGIPTIGIAGSLGREVDGALFGHDVSFWNGAFATTS